VVDASPHYVQVLDYVREMAHSLTFIYQPVFKHIDNNHKGIIPVQQEELKELTGNIQSLTESCRQIILNNEFDKLSEITDSQENILDDLKNYRKKQIKRIKAEDVGTRNSTLYISILQESKNFILYLVNLLKSHRDFIEHN
jgi:Na+/phosphate symporter